MIVPSWAAHCSWWIMLKNVATLVGPKITALLTALLNITEQLAQLVLWLDIHSKPVLCQLQYYINNLKMFLHQIKIGIDSIPPLLKSGCAKNMRFRNFGGEGGVKVIWRNPALTGFSLMMASLTKNRNIWKNTNKIFWNHALMFSNFIFRTED